ncbi:MAG: hypothetical protein L6R42_003388 [Xanthoria sp. 1 TBL-2021]|nr:MAG: hypothetical protein L6R42_003388 [Xanthoria sp. 1 TBL-2021]
MASSISSPQALRQSNCRPFLSLPDVIRERIYHFVLTIDVNPTAPWITPLPTLRRLHLPALPPEPNRDLLMASKSVRKKRRRKIRQFESIKMERAIAAQTAPHSCLAILATCRTILLEAFHLWYKNNTFNFARSQDVVAFLTSISRVRANEIRAVRLDLPWEDYHDLRAGQALRRLLRLETVIFVYRGDSFNWISPKYISYPRIISHLQGLREATFVDPPSSGTSVPGVEQGMGTCHRSRTDQLREKMMAKRKHPRPAPPMMDLFSRLRNLDQSKKDCARWKWHENSAYAPEIDCGLQHLSSLDE